MGVKKKLNSKNVKFLQYSCSYKNQNKLIINRKKVDKWILFYHTAGFEWTTVMDVLDLNSMNNIYTLKRNN